MSESGKGPHPPRCPGCNAAASVVLPDGPASGQRLCHCTDCSLRFADPMAAACAEWYSKSPLYLSCLGQHGCTLLDRKPESALLAGSFVMLWMAWMGERNDCCDDSAQTARGRRPGRTSEVEIPAPSLEADGRGVRAERSLGGSAGYGSTRSSGLFPTP